MVVPRCASAAFLLLHVLLPACRASDESLPALSADDQCGDSGTCALQALQHHADRKSEERVEVAETAAVKANVTGEHDLGEEKSEGKKTEKAGQTKVQKEKTASIFDCKKDTGGTCSWFGCSKSRHADCEKGKCTCGPNLCARSGKCQIAEGYKMEKTTMAERDTGGSCRFFACDESRGPTHCDRNQGYKCFCADGFKSIKGQCIPNLVSTLPPNQANQSPSPAPFDWTKVDWSKAFQKNGWSATTDWSKIDWNKIYGGAGTPGNPLGAGYGYGLPYGTPGGGMPPYTPPSPYAYANPYGVPYWR
eukprot:Skav220184  [mRNA]  locus=scaffold1074:16568:36948:- [translate_table: standard]